MMQFITMAACLFLILQSCTLEAEIEKLKSDHAEFVVDIQQIQADIASVHSAQMDMKDEVQDVKKNVDDIHNRLGL